MLSMNETKVSKYFYYYFTNNLWWISDIFWNNVFQKINFAKESVQSPFLFKWYNYHFFVSVIHIRCIKKIGLVYKHKTKIIESKDLLYLVLTTIHGLVTIKYGISLCFHIWPKDKYYSILCHNFVPKLNYPKFWFLFWYENELVWIYIMFVYFCKYYIWEAQKNLYI